MYIKELLTHEKIGIVILDCIALYILIVFGFPNNMLISSNEMNVKLGQLADIGGLIIAPDIIDRYMVALL